MILVLSDHIEAAARGKVQFPDRFVHGSMMPYAITFILPDARVHRAIKVRAD